MSQRSDPNRQPETRADGRLEFSPQGRAIAERRTNAEKGGRLGRLLGPKSQFSDAFKSAFDPDTEYEQINSRINLRKELEAATKTIKALKSAPDDPEAQHVLADMMSHPFQRKQDCVLCPIWRHERETYLALAARSRYVFPKVIDQLYLATVVFDFAENLDQIEDALSAAQSVVTKAVAHMGRKGFGVMMIGSFELDLLSHEQLTTEFKSQALMKELGITAPESGGWVVTGHFFVRAPHHDVLKVWFDRQFPSSTRRWLRVKFDAINSDKALLESLSRIISYAGKMPQPLFDAPTRSTKDEKRNLANFKIQRLLTAFYGQKIPERLDKEDFDIDAAIVQWAKFMHRVGPKLAYYSIESTHAQKWLSESETHWLQSQVEELDAHGLRNFPKDTPTPAAHLIEYHRDRCIDDPDVWPKQLSGFKPKFRSRPLRYDPNWEIMTDCTGIDSKVERPDFTKWLLSL